MVSARIRSSEPYKLEPGSKIVQLPKLTLNPELEIDFFPSVRFGLWELGTWGLSVA